MLGSPIGPTVMAMQASIGQVMHHPLGVFSLLVAISAAVPPLIRRIGLPDLVGLLVAGVVVGPHALNWVDSGSEQCGCSPIWGRCICCSRWGWRSTWRSSTGLNGAR